MDRLKLFESILDDEDIEHEEFLKRNPGVKFDVDRTVYSCTKLAVESVERIKKHAKQSKFSHIDGQLDVILRQLKRIEEDIGIEFRREEEKELNRLFPRD